MVAGTIAAMLQPPNPPAEVFDARAARLTGTVRRLVRRGARRSISRLLARMRPEDVGMMLDVLTPAEQVEVFRVAVEEHRDAAGEVLLSMEPARMVNLVSRLDPAQIADVLHPMAVDDAVGLVEMLPEEDRQPVLELLDKRGGDDLHLQLHYAEDTAGRIMNTEYFSLPEETTVEEAIARIQTSGNLEMVFYLYVTDPEGGLVGVTSLRQLILARPEARLGEIAERSVIMVSTETDQEEVARLASRYDLLAIPVVDEIGRLVGIVTVDDVIDVLQDEADEDFYRMVGTSEDELLYRERSWRVARIRLPWLLINLTGLYLTGLIFKYFETTLQELLILVFFAPVIMGMGGNIGAQTSTIAVRGLATGRLAQGQGRVRAFLGQQIRVGALLGLVCAPIAGVGVWVLQQSWVLVAVVSFSLFVAIFLASVNGSVVPLMFQRFGIDPAVAAGPMVTTTSDMVGIAVYFAVAAAMIRNFVI
ncbi:MAG: magnesium transporter [Acidobacteria bacterium]|nr:MAG: magnesium transporter [Acidobacteriota bacterium]REK01073.1 MAG: magnesium transporter [Acidobacteriota bacterium]